MHPIRRVVSAAALLLTLAVPSLALAAIETKVLLPTDTGISGLAINSSRTMTIPIGGYSQITVYVQLTRVAATSINVVCSAGPSASYLGQLAVANITASSGSIAMVDGSFSYPVSTSRWLRFQIMPLNDAYLSCVFTGTSAGGSDLISVHARLGVP